MTERHPPILAEGLEKSYGKTTALQGLSLMVQEGTVLGVLGPNGAGKTTMVRILSTLLRPDAGWARVAGFDVVQQADKVRAHIGLTGQYAAVDEYLTGRENLEMIGRLYHLSSAQARLRAAELLERFDLVDAASRPVKTYSGGMRRRLDIALTLLVPLPVLFLDEPTAGLDPRSRLAVWDLVHEVVASGTTLLLTTQYLEEADQLADQIVVIDGGRVIAEGTADELKAQVGGAQLELTVARSSDLDLALQTLQLYGTGHVDAQRRLLTIPVTTDSGLLPGIVRELDTVGVHLDDLRLRRPTLDDVFLTLTGHTTEQVAAQETNQTGGRPLARRKE